MKLLNVFPRRLRGFTAGTLVVAVAGALVGTVFGLGAMGQAPAVFDGSAWLWSRPVGEVSRLNGDSGTVDLRQPLVDSRGHRIRVTQDDNFLLLHDLDTGRMTSVDLSRMGFSGSLAVDPGNDVTVVLSGERATVVDRTRGLVRSLDPATLQVRGEPLQLPAPLVGGAYDTNGALWLGLPGQGTVVAVTGSGDDLAVTRTVPVAEPGHDLAVSVLDKGVLAVDRSGDAMVAVSGKETKRMKAPVKLASAVMPERTVGDLAVVTVPPDRAAVTIEDVDAGGPVGKVALPVGAQTAVPFAGRIYVPDEKAGLVRVYNKDGNPLKPISVPRSTGTLELLVREQHLFINAVDAPTAVVVDPGGETSTVDKYGPGAAVPDPTVSPTAPSRPTATTGPPKPPSPSKTSRPKPTPTEDRPSEKPGAPGVPVPVTVLAGDGQVRVTWGRAATRGGAGVDRYVVTWNGGRVEVAGDQLSTLVTGLRNGTEYRFRVVAQNAYGSSAPALSEPVTPVGAAPARPGAPTATVAAGRVTVSWAAVPDAGSYVVTPLRDGEAGDNPPQTVTGLSTEFEGLAPGATYTFTVVARAATGGGASQASPPSNAVVPFTRPGRPANVATRQTNTNTYTVTWGAANANGRPITAYIVRAGDITREVAGGARTATITSAEALTQVSVAAVNAAGEGAAAIVSVEAMPRVTVTINDVLEGDDDVIVLFRVTNPGGGAVRCTVAAGSQSATGCGGRVEVDGLNPSTNYTVTVTATANGQSANDTRQVTTYPRGTEGNIHCHDDPANADPDFCERGVPIFDSPGWNPSAAVDYNMDDYRIFAVCREYGETVDARPYGGKQSGHWIFKAGGHWVPEAFVYLDNGDNIDAIAPCK
ncbi:fibronectin type III domain-containing protein [Micromonospora sp. CPCC 206061]|uniref:fibronectin type III domain-containing protein n=1 Tax=Micromonospora sp. CPCC 206061 TaxID=3122410 RepID=UPI002FF069D1